MAIAPAAALAEDAGNTADVITEVRREEALLKTGALQNAIFNSANFSSIATDEKGVIQIFNVGAERMLGYEAADVVNRITPADISDPYGTVVVDAACDKNAPERIRVSVKDSGAGLPADMVSQLFQPFNRLGQEKSSEEGTGIGLVMSKRLVELMGGEIGVESAVGTGSVFWFELNSALAPQLIADGPELPAHAQAQMEPNAPLRTLLYVEDNPANLKLIEQLVARRPDMRLLSASDGSLGIQLARTHQPEVILMDINLPGISGIEALQILRGDPTTSHIPVMALSANAMPRDIEKGLQAGFFRYLTKPIKVGEFLQTLDTALEFAREGAAHAK